MDRTIQDFNADAPDAGGNEKAMLDLGNELSHFAEEMRR
jgi:hypothetical protein